MSSEPRTQPLTVKELKEALAGYPETDLDGHPVLVYHATGKLLDAPVSAIFYGFNGKIILGRHGDF